MTKKEFRELFINNGPEKQKDILEMKEGNRVVIYRKLDFIHNKAIEAFKPSLDNLPLQYATDFRARVTEIGHQDYEKAGNIKKDELFEKLKESKLINFFIEKKIPFETKIVVLPSSVAVYGEPHHFNVYAKVTVNIEYIYCYYGQKYKRKIFLFTKDGVLTIKYPPYNLQDDVKNIGVTPFEDTLEIVE